MDVEHSAISLSFSDGDCTAIARLEINATAADFPYVSFTPVVAALSLVATNISDGRAQSSSLPRDSEELRSLQNNLVSCPLYAGTHIPFELAKSENHNKASEWEIRLARTDTEIRAAGGEASLARFDNEMLSVFAAILEDRQLDRFPEATDDPDIMKRRRIWTGACLAAASLLPCRIEHFLVAAESISLLLSPPHSWLNTRESISQRLCAAVRAGVVLPDLSAKSLVPHPSIPEWRRVLGRAEHIWDSLGRLAINLSGMPSHFLQSIRNWAMHDSGSMHASGHDILEASQIVIPNEALLTAARTEFLPLLSGYPLPPPLIKERVYA